MRLKAAHISGSIKQALQVKGIWGMCYTMARLSAHYGALLGIGWYFGSRAAVVFATTTRIYLPRKSLTLTLLTDDAGFPLLHILCPQLKKRRSILEPSEQTLPEVHLSFLFFCPASLMAVPTGHLAIFKAARWSSPIGPNCRFSPSTPTVGTTSSRESKSSSTALWNQPLTSQH